MKHLDKFSDYKPNFELIDSYTQLVVDKYPVYTEQILGRPTKYIMIGDKMQYVTGPVYLKSRLVDKICFDMEEDGDFHQPSLRRAIKTWLDSLQ